MRGYWILLLPCLLMGCSPVVTVVSLAVTGASYATTGKSVADHGISAVADEDCAMLRALKGEDVCQPDNYTYALDVLPAAGGVRAPATQAAAASL